MATSMCWSESQISASLLQPERRDPPSKKLQAFTFQDELILKIFHLHQMKESKNVKTFETSMQLSPWALWTSPTGQVAVEEEVVVVDKRKKKRSNNMSSANQAKGEKDYHSIKVPKYNSRNSREINNIYRCLTAMVEKRHPEKTSRYQEMTLLTFSFLIFVSTSLTLDWKLACAFDHYSTFIVQPCMENVNKELFFFPYFLSAPMSVILSTSMLATMSTSMSATM